MRITTPPFLALFPNLYRPAKPMDPGQTPKYEVTMLWPADADLSELRAAIDAVAKEKLKGPLTTPLIRDGNAKADELAARNKNGEMYRGKVYAVARGIRRPEVVQPSAEGLIPVEEADFYAGRECRASVEVYAYFKGKKGVSLGLGNVLVIGEGERIGGGASAESDFADMADSVI